MSDYSATVACTIKVQFGNLFNEYLTNVKRRGVHIDPITCCSIQNLCNMTTKIIYVLIIIIIIIII
jgi:hypothetical protein